MFKHILVSAAAALALAMGTLGATTDDAYAQRGGHGGGMMWPQGGWHGGGGGNWHGGGGGNWHGGGGGNWHGGGGHWHGGGWNGGDWGWGWGWGPAFGLGLGYGTWGYGASRVCEPVYRAAKVRTSHGWRWRNIYVGDRCYWTNY